MFQLPPDSKLSDQDREVKIDIARKIGLFLSGEQSDDERKVAEDLARQLLEDSSLEVRKAFSSAVQECRFLPTEMAKTIANDLDEVSKPFLLDNSTLDHDTLEYIARECHETTREILALRNNLPEPVSYAIAELGQEVAVENLMSNKTAEVSERVCVNVTDRFPENEKILNKMAERDDLPLTVIEVLVKRISEEIIAKLTKRYGMGEDYAAYLGGEAELKVMQSALKKSSDAELKSFMKIQVAKNKLEGPVILQMLKSGDFRAFKYAIAVRSNLDYGDIKSLLQDGTLGAFRVMLQKAGLNERMARFFLSTYEEAIRKLEAA